MRTAEGELVWDSGEAFECITARAFPDDFNWTNDEDDGFDTRSDAKEGPEPENVVVGEVGGTPLAFNALERTGGSSCTTSPISDPTPPEFVQYLITRVFDCDDSVVPDEGPEGMAFVPAATRPTGAALLAMGNEVTGTVNLFGVVEG